MKRWYKSKTLWLNLLGAVFTALEASTGLLQQVLPMNSYATIAIVLAVLNAILRVITTQPIGRDA